MPLLAQRLSLLRGIGISLLSVLLLLAAQVQFPLPYPLLLGITLGWLLLQGVFLSLPQGWTMTERGVLLALVMDLLILASLLAFSGGIHNPFFALLILPLLLGVGILSPASQRLLLLLLLLAASLILWLPVPLGSAMPQLPSDVYSLLFYLHGALVTDLPFNPRDSLAKLGLWLNLCLLAILITLVLARLHHTLQQQQLALEDAYRYQQQQTHLLQLGFTAAATAHELATPLSTMSLLASEAKDAYHDGDDAGAEQALAQIQDLVQHCKIHLQQGLKKQQTQKIAMKYDDYLKQQLIYWQNTRPQARAQLHLPAQPSEPIPQVRANLILDQILLILLNNAADASPQPCDLYLTWDTQQIRIEIHSHGLPFSTQTLKRFPAPQISHKTDGRGIGLSLAYHQAVQLGGDLQLDNTRSGSARVSLRLPNLSAQKDHFLLE